MKNRILVYILLFIGVASFGQNLEIPQFGSDSTFEVMTWNIEWFPKNGQITLDYVSEIVMDLDIDVLALQEIDDKFYFDQLIEGLEGWNGYYVNSEYSNLAYLYKTDEVEVIDIYEIYTTSEYWRPFPRAPMVFEFMFMSKKYILINNHFKCCGDGYLDSDDPWDEEKRRLDASNLLEEYISSNFSNEKVILLGDLNDILTDETQNNVFLSFLNNPNDYQFVDMEIAEDENADWSYPSWPSHIDHILISNELFDEFENEDSEIKTITLDAYFDGGWYEYDENVSDHRPVALRLKTEAYLNVEDTEFQSLSVYPDPCQQYLHIKIESRENLSLWISDLKGRILKEINLIAGNNTINVGFLNDGMYILHIRRNKLFQSVKFIKTSN